MSTDRQLSSARINNKHENESFARRSIAIVIVTTLLELREFFELFTIVGSVNGGTDDRLRRRSIKIAPEMAWWHRVDNGNLVTDRTLVRSSFWSSELDVKAIGFCVRS